MSELHYGKNVEWFLRELSAHEAGDIESAEIEVIGENDQGVEGFTTIDITLLAADAVSVISALQQKLDAVLAENVALKVAIKDAHKCAEECEFNGEFCYVVPSCELEALGDCLDETPATDAILNEVRAEGAQYCIDAIVTSDSADFIDAPNICAEVMRQLRAGSKEGGV